MRRGVRMVVSRLYNNTRGYTFEFCRIIDFLLSSGS